MDILHDGHPGITKMKQLARSIVWWPRIDAHIETKVKHCEQCAMLQKSPSPVPLHPWEWPNRPWTRIHGDYAGPFMGKMFLVLIDAHSKWMEVQPDVQLRPLTQFMLYGQYLQHLVCRKFSSQIMEVFLLVRSFESLLNAMESGI